jgi:hypothetical protein
MKGGDDVRLAHEFLALMFTLPFTDRLGVIASGGIATNARHAI